MIEYKGYTANPEYDPEAGVLHGIVLGLRDVVSFEADRLEDVEQAFHDSVDDYLEFCAERGEEPERPFSGKFLVRFSSEVHKAIYMAAFEANVSMNRLIVEMVEKALRTRSMTPRENDKEEPQSSTATRSTEDDLSEKVAELSKLMAMQARMIENLAAETKARGGVGADAEAKPARQERHAAIR
jgi:predicted HicB family RNase H-like nuclease